MLAPVSTSAATPTTTVERECLRAAAVLGIGAAGAGVLLWAASFPGWPLAAGVMISVLVIAGLLAVSGGHPPRGGARWLRPAAVIAALLITLGGGVIIGRVGHVALSIRFANSVADFDATAAAAGPVPTEVADHWLPYPGECPRQIGSYEISACHGFTGGFMYYQDRDAWGDDAGFAYAPGGPPTDQSGFTHLRGPWYAWSCGC